MKSIDEERREQFVAQLDEVIKEFEDFHYSRKNTTREENARKSQRVTMRCCAAIERATREQSPYRKQMGTILTKWGSGDYGVLMLAGIAEGLRDDLQSGYVDSFQEMVRGDLFADYLDMAKYLLAEGYKDAAASIAGGTLEAHLRKLCQKNGISIDVNGTRKKASIMNVELKKKGVYELNEQQQVTAWLAIRNPADHAEYEKYDAPQVDVMISGIRDFTIRHPA